MLSGAGMCEACPRETRYAKRVTYERALATTLAPRATDWMEQITCQSPCMGVCYWIST